jgi:cellulose synthase/poly-beta-1,6-N-acetylglucosamine synthase-like glycosyltransferase
MGTSARPSAPAAGIAVDGAAGSPAAPPAVSVVVTTRGDPPRLERCVRSLLASRYANFEVIVVASREGSGLTRAMLAERFADELRVRYVEQSRPGLTSARNAGLMAAKGELVAFAEDDMVVDPDWVVRAAEAFERADAVACATGLTLLLRVETESRRVLEQFAAHSKGCDLLTFRLADHEHPLLPYTHGLISSGANTVVRADLARRLGGFDTDLGTATWSAGGEDLHLYIRLLRSGQAIAHEPRAIVRDGEPSETQATRSPLYENRVALSSGRPVSVVSFPDQGPGPTAKGHRPAAPTGTPRALVATAALAIVALALASVWADVQAPEGLLYAVAAIALALLALQLGRRRQAG